MIDFRWFVQNIAEAESKATNPFQKNVQKAIESIIASNMQTPKEYGEGWERARFGCQEDVYFLGRKVMTAGQTTYCCGITEQIFWKALEATLLEKFTLAELQEIIAANGKMVSLEGDSFKSILLQVHYHFFVREDIDPCYAVGPFGLWSLLEQLFFLYHLSFERGEDDNFEFGDFVQITNSPTSGHSVIALFNETVEEKPVFGAFSSSSNNLDSSSGVGYDWFAKNKTGRSFKWLRIRSNLK